MSIIQQLTGVSSYETEAVRYTSGPGLGSAQVRMIRKLRGGLIQQSTQARLRWYPNDVERAQQLADAGDLGLAAQLWQAAQTDGVFHGLLSTRTGGLVRLPKLFRGRDDIVQELQAGNNSVRSVFDEMFPPSEIAKMAADGVGLGVGVGELLPVDGRDYPVFARLDPQWLIYRWSDNRWLYRSVAGLIPVEPGDGRWVLHTPGGRLQPWNGGIWQAVGRAFIRKLVCDNLSSAWESKLANPARVAFSPSGAAEPQKESWFRKVLAWNINSVFGVPPGYDVKLVESNGRGHEAFAKTIARSEREMILAVSGQEVTTDGGSGFSNTDVHQRIRTDLIKETADGLAYTINTQGIPTWVQARWGEDAVYESAIVSWDVTPPKDHNATAQAMTAAATAIKSLKDALKPFNLQPNVEQIVEAFGIPILDSDATRDRSVELTPSANEAIVKVDEARDVQGLEPIGDERGDLTVEELRNESKQADGTDDSDL